MLPGEHVEVRIDREGKRGVDYGTLLSVLEEAPQRVPARCPHFLDCGGCDLLHADLAFQHRLKRRAVADALGLRVEQVEPVIASPKPLGYRALAKLVVGPDRILGSYRPRTHDVVSMEGCLIHAPEVEAVVGALRSWIREPATLDLRYVLVRGSLAEGKAVVTLVSRTEQAPGVRALAARLFERPDVARVVLDVNPTEGDVLLSGREEILFDRGPPSERIGEISQSLASGAFAQVNPAAAALLYALVREMIEPRGKRVVDLYSGSGGIALTLAAAGASVIGVEAVPAAVEAARASAGGAAEFVCADVRHYELPPADAVVLNPPRKGAPPELLERLRDVPCLVYVSCNPKTLARDLEILGRPIDRVVPVDLFPQTGHVETVVRSA